MVEALKTKYDRPQTVLRMRVKNFIQYKMVEKNLKSLRDADFEFVENMKCLERHKDVTLDTLMIAMAKLHLNEELFQSWQIYVGKLKVPPSTSDFYEFISKQATLAEGMLINIPARYHYQVPVVPCTRNH